MLLDYFRRSKHSRTKSKQDLERDVPGEAGLRATGAATAHTQHGGFFTNASGFSMHNSNFNDFQNAQIQNFILQVIVDGTAVLERLLPHICKGALVDSSDRIPPPRCHEGTREKILNSLAEWLESQLRLWKIIWLYGPAGTGKSAVAQSFAEHCATRSRLGAVFFFSRANERNDPQTVVPTLAYQLSVACSEYKTIIAELFANNPLLIEKSPRTQFADLITGPFSTLQKRGHQVSREPLVIVLDGLDECAGTDAQCEFIEIIREAMTSKDLPLMWLIVSRPEPHLKYMFSRVDYPVKCNKHQLFIDAETRKDVRRYMRDGLNGIRAKFFGVGDGTWPSSMNFEKLVRIADGLFALATAMLNYIGDATFANPTRRLLDFLAFMEQADPLVVDNPLKTLDLLYSRILADVPPTDFPTTKLVLSITFCAFLELEPPMNMANFLRGDESMQALANFLRLDEDTFYAAVRQLHSVIDIPPAAEAVERRPIMYHTSFKDYLSNPLRSGAFSVGASEKVAFYKLLFFWYQVTWDCHASDDRVERRPGDFHRSILPHLKWTSVGLTEQLAVELDRFVWSFDGLWLYISSTPYTDPEHFFPLLEQCDFRHMPFRFAIGFLRLVNWLFELQQENCVLQPLLRTGPSTDLDQLLLASIMGVDLTVNPASFPLTKASSYTWSYFFLGRGRKTCLFFTNLVTQELGRSRLSCKAQPGGCYTVDDCVIRGPKKEYNLLQRR